METLTAIGGWVDTVGKTVRGIFTRKYEKDEKLSANENFTKRYVSDNENFTDRYQSDNEKAINQLIQEQKSRRTVIIAISSFLAVTGLVLVLFKRNKTT